MYILQIYFVSINVLYNAIFPLINSRKGRWVLAFGW